MYRLGAHLGMLTHKGIPDNLLNTSNIFGSTELGDYLHGVAPLCHRRRFGGTSEITLHNIDNGFSMPGKFLFTCKHVIISFIRLHTASLSAISISVHEN
ncbi:hypothetical protein L1987_10183 [Smallanthus sonchifolius]|uniref:Uncharacterized protein n=1 Tax=Smallanthus sonchifolius TaxID=185202 RepID=A0ACB9JRR0_9ASTR|nr:hypothetical protein L1987_10183 [Smallanthus sonchifolius]